MGDTGAGVDHFKKCSNAEEILVTLFKKYENIHNRSKGMCYSKMAYQFTNAINRVREIQKEGEK